MANRACASALLTRATAPSPLARSRRAHHRRVAPLRSRGIVALSTSTNADTNAVTRTETAARVTISETKSGIVQYSFGAVPQSRSRDPALAEERAARSGMDKYDDKDASQTKKELVFDVTLDAEGGANATGLVFEKGPDGLLVVAKIRPGGTAAGVVKPGDVLLGCSLLVNVEDEDGEFTEELRWHDATAHGPEHTLTMLLTHGEEMNVRTCRGYVVKRDKAIRSAWAQLVPTSPAKDIRSCWNRLLYHVEQEEKPKNGAKKKKEMAKDNTPRGIWGGLVGKKVVPVEDSVRDAWGAIYPDIIVPAEEWVGEDAVEQEPAAEEEPAAAGGGARPGRRRRRGVDGGEAGGRGGRGGRRRLPPSRGVHRPRRRRRRRRRGSRRRGGRQGGTPRRRRRGGVEEADEDEGFFGKFKGVEGQFDVLEVSVDCSRGVNMTGLMLGQDRSDGLLHVRVCKPGGTAHKKIKIGDVILATTYVVLTPDPSTGKPVATLEWLDATDGASNEDIQGAMMTHSQEMKLVLARGDVPSGHFDQPSPAARERCSDAAIGGGVAQPEECVPEDVKAWAARVAAEAKAAQAEAEREREAAAVKAAAGGNREEKLGAMSPEEIKAWAARVAAEARGEK